MVDERAGFGDYEEGEDGPGVVSRMRLREEGCCWRTWWEGGRGGPSSRSGREHGAQSTIQADSPDPAHSLQLLS